LTALGANILNVGVIAGFTGFYIYKLAKPLGKTLRAVIGGFFAGLLSLVVTSAAVAVEMWLAGTFPLVEGLIFMTFYHAVVGVVEGIMTMVGCVLLTVLRSQRKSQKNKDISL
jgi:cobalt/nickel transport system permease protein